jgi:uncharacterized protein YdhG (YjbR/CyaY superfamily)
MAMNKTAPAKNVDEYISQFPAEVQVSLNKLRKTIKAAATKAEEMISYQMPAYKYNGMLVYFAAYKNHIGFYPTGSGIEAFKKELSAYKGAKGAVQFPIDKPIPLALITKIVQFRVQANLEKDLTKKKKTTPAKPVKAKKPTDEEQVTAYMSQLEPGVKAEIDAVRKIIKKANPKLNERIKWNAPSYHYKEDIVTFGPYRTQKLLLVFHHPAVVKIKSEILEGDYKDRRLVRFKNIAEAEKKKKELTRIINEIVHTIDKQLK